MGAMLLIVTLTLVGSALSVPIRQQPETLLCAAEDNFVSFGDEESCIKYYQCYSGLAYHMQCPDFTWFNQVEQKCDESSSPPQGCEVAQPPHLGPPEEPEEPDESIEEPEEPEIPIETPEEPIESPEVPVDEPEDPSEEPVQPEDPEEPIEIPEEPIEEPEKPSEIESPTEDLNPPLDQSQEQIETEEPDIDTENPIDEEEINNNHSINEPEGSGDPVSQEQSTEPINSLEALNIAEGSGFEEFRNHLVRRLGRIEEFERFEASGDFPDSNAFNIQIDELFIANMVPDNDILYEKPSIDPVLILPEYEAWYK